MKEQDVIDQLEILVQQRGILQFIWQSAYSESFNSRFMTQMFLGSL